MAVGQVNGDLDWPSPNEDMLPDQVATVITLERFGGAASMVGVMLIFVTYVAFKRLRTVPNLFITMASIANVGASIACLMGRDGIAQGESSALCQAQAFMLEMLMQSDPWWSLAMAVNVFLVFFFGASTTLFRRYLWIYAVICYGVPLIPAFVLLFVKDDERGSVYGDATLWCWIEPRWNALRIYTYYLPIWVCIFFSAVIYVAVGCHVFHQRNQLRNLTFSNQGKDAKEAWGSDNRDSAEKNLTSRQDYYGTAVTEVQVVSSSESNPSWTPAQSPSSAHLPRSIAAATMPTPAGPAMPKSAVLARPKPPNPIPGLFDDPTTITPPQTNPPSPSPTGPTPHGNVDVDIDSSSSDSEIDPAAAATTSARPPRRRSRSHPHHHHHDIPHHHHQQPCFETTCVSTQPPRPRSFLSRLPLWRRVGAFFSTFRHKYRRVDTVKKAYLRTSAIFAFSVLFTWTPSSINRVYSLLYPENVHYGLNVASAFVLPLQGVWNAVIYFSTSWRPLCEEVQALRDRHRGRAATIRLENTGARHGGGAGCGGAGGDGAVAGGVGGSCRVPVDGVRFAGQKTRPSEESSEVELTKTAGSGGGGGGVRTQRRDSGNQGVVLIVASVDSGW